MDRQLYSFSILLLYFCFCAGSQVEMDLLAELRGRHRDSMVRPSDAIDGVVPIRAGLHVNDVKLHVSRRKITVDGWLTVEWNNTRLSWADTATFAKVQRTRLHMSEMWLPDLVIYNRSPASGIPWLTQVPAIVFRNGRVLVVPPVSFTVRCQRQVKGTTEMYACPIKLGSWTHHKGELDLLPTANKVDTTYVPGGGKWTVVSSNVTRQEISYDCCTERYVTLNMELLLRPSQP